MPALPRALAKRPSLRRRALLLALGAAALALMLVAPAFAVDCDGITLPDGCLFTATGGDTADPDDGFGVTNAAGVPLWDFYQTLDLQKAGYPISQRSEDGVFTLQAFQKVILQWDPDKSRFNYLNTLDILHNRFSVNLPNVPAHQNLMADAGAPFSQVVQNHLAILDQNSKIKADGWAPGRTRRSAPAVPSISRSRFWRMARRD